jgi:hypothetical protein
MTAITDSGTASPMGAVDRRQIGFLFLVIVADAAVLAAGGAHAASVAPAIAAHIALACSLGFFRDARGDRTAGIVAMVSTLSMGPLGAVGSLVLIRQLETARRRDDSLRKRYDMVSFQDETDPAGDIHEAVTEGRAFTLDASRLNSFATVLAEGKVGEKQALLGTISQRFHPDFLPSLQKGLKSPEAAVRVSAAAVFAKLREDNRKRFRAVATGQGERETAETCPNGAGVARMLAGCARSRLLNAAEASQARSEALRLLLLERPRVVAFDATEELLCGLLFEAGRRRDVEARLARHSTDLPPVLKDLLLRALMHSQRYAGVAGVAGIVRPGAGRSSESNSFEPSVRPLLAAQGQVA